MTGPDERERPALLSLVRLIADAGCTGTHDHHVDDCPDDNKCAGCPCWGHVAARAINEGEAALKAAEASKANAEHEAKAAFKLHRQAIGERDALRAELARVTAERDDMAALRDEEKGIRMRHFARYEAAEARASTADGLLRDVLEAEFNGRGRVALPPGWLSRATAHLAAAVPATLVVPRCRHYAEPATCWDCANGDGDANHEPPAAFPHVHRWVPVESHGGWCCTAVTGERFCLAPASVHCGDDRCGGAGRCPEHEERAAPSLTVGADADGTPHDLMCDCAKCCAYHAATQPREERAAPVEPWRDPGMQRAEALLASDRRDSDTFTRVLAALAAKREAWDHLEGQRQAVDDCIAAVKSLQAAPVEPARVPRAGDVWRVGRGPREVVLRERIARAGHVFAGWDMEDGSTFFDACFTDGTLTFVRPSAEPTITGGEGLLAVPPASHADDLAERLKRARKFACGWTSRWGKIACPGNDGKEHSGICDSLTYAFDDEVGRAATPGRTPGKEHDCQGHAYPTDDGRDVCTVCEKELPRDFATSVKCTRDTGCRKGDRHRGACWVPK